MNFSTLEEYPFDGSGETYTPYAGQDSEGNWVEGSISKQFLNDNFGQYSTASEMKEATTSEGLQLYFDWLVEQEKLEA